MGFKYLEGIALAEAAFEAKGNNLKELFESCADAFIDTSANPETIKSSFKKEIFIQANNVEDLLFKFLEELVFIKDSEAVVFNKTEILEISENKLKVLLIGEEINQESQELRADIKAITLHKFNVKKTDDGWIAIVVMDI